MHLPPPMPAVRGGSLRREGAGAPTDPGRAGGRVPCGGARADSRADRGDGVVDPVLLQGAFRVGFVILILALLVLPFEDPSSPEFVAAFFAVVVGLVFG